MNTGNIHTILIADEINIRFLKKYAGKDFKIVYSPRLSNEELHKLIDKINAKILIIRSTRKIDRLFLSRTSIKYLCTLSRGTDHIDVHYSNKLKIKVFNTIEGNADAAAEHTFALILAIYKNLIYSDSLVRNGRFNVYDYKRNNLKDKTIGIIGIGKVGKRVARIAGAFGMKVMANDINPDVIKSNKYLDFYDINSLFSESDIITIHIPGNQGNINFINSSLLSLMKRNSVLINTSRGSVLEEKFLLELISGKIIYYCGLDVFKNEPIIDERFKVLGNCILTNHIGGKTSESDEFMIKEIIMQVKKSL